MGNEGKPLSMEIELIGDWTLKRFNYNCLWTDCFLPHLIHVRYIYPHLAYISMVNVGKYTLELPPTQDASPHQDYYLFHF